MPGTPLRLLSACCLAALLIAPAPRAAGPDQKATHAFKVTIAGTVDLETMGKKQKMVADTELHYRWQRAGRERTLLLTSTRVRLAVNGKPVMDVAMSRAGLKAVAGGETKEVTLEKAPNRLKEALRACFDAPLCQVQVDADGREVKRTVVAGPGAEAVLDNGMVANARLFHPPFPRDRGEWQADAEVSMGKGGYVRGKLTYKKVAGGRGGQVVRVSGTLSNKEFPWPGTSFSAANVKHVVSGEQTYDPALGEWVAGRLNVTASFQLKDEHELEVGSAKGTMTWSFERTAGKE